MEGVLKDINRNVFLIKGEKSPFEEILLKRVAGMNETYSRCDFLGDVWMFLRV